MDIEYQWCMRADLFNKEGRQGDIFHIMPIHNVDVQHIRTAVQHRQLLFDVDQAHAHQRGGDFVLHHDSWLQRE
ncbi:hypothetical protein D3C73_1625220 [compost metagenome]